MFQFIRDSHYLDTMFSRGLNHILCNLFPQGPLDVTVYTGAVICAASNEEGAQVPKRGTIGGWPLPLRMPSDGEMSPQCGLQT